MILFCQTRLHTLNVRLIFLPDKDVNNCVLLLILVLFFCTSSIFLTVAFIICVFCCLLGVRASFLRDRNFCFYPFIYHICLYFAYTLRRIMLLKFRIKKGKEKKTQKIVNNVILFIIRNYLFSI